MKVCLIVLHLFLLEAKFNIHKQRKEIKTHFTILGTKVNEWKVFLTIPSIDSTFKKSVTKNGDSICIYIK